MILYSSKPRQRRFTDGAPPICPRFNKTGSGGGLRSLPSPTHAGMPPYTIQDTCAGACRTVPHPAAGLCGFQAPCPDIMLPGGGSKGQSRIFVTGATSMAGLGAYPDPAMRFVVLSAPVRYPGRMGADPAAGSIQIPCGCGMPYWTGCSGHATWTETATHTILWPDNGAPYGGAAQAPFRRL